MFIKARLIEQLKNEVSVETNKPGNSPVDWKCVHGIAYLIIDLENAEEHYTIVDEYFEIVKTLSVYYNAEKYEKPVQIALNCLSKISPL